MYVCMSTLEQRWEEACDRLTEYCRMCSKIAYGFWKKRSTVTVPYVRYLVKKVKDTGILISKPKRENPKTMRTPENIAAVAKSRRILHKDLGMMPYKVQLVQELKSIHHPMRFVSLSGPAIDLQKIPSLAKKIIFSDEAHFDLGEYVNKQNCRI